MRKQQDQQNRQFAKALANSSISDPGLRELALKALSFSRRVGRYFKTRRVAVDILMDLERAANY